MRRIFLCFLIYFCITNYCYAAPCIGTRMPQENQFFAGFQSHSVLNRYLADGYGKMRSLQEFFLISYGIFDWLSLDAKGGAGYIKRHPVGADEIDYSAYLGGGYGLRLQLYNNEQTKVIFGFQHVSVHPHKIHVNGIKNKAVLDDWQFSLLASRNFSMFTPYIGTKWSRMDYINWLNGERSRIKSDLTRDVGLVFGVDLPMSFDEKMWLNIEGQFFDVEAFAVSLNSEF